MTEVSHALGLAGATPAVGLVTVCREYLQAHRGGAPVFTGEEAPPEEPFPPEAKKPRARKKKE